MSSRRAIKVNAIKELGDILYASNAKAILVQITRTTDFSKTSKPCHVGIYRIALAEYSQMRAHVPGF